MVLRLSSNMIGNSNDETNFLHELLLNNRQVANLRKDFANNSLADIKLSKTQLSKIYYLTIRRISWQTSWCITKNKITINKKYN